MSDGGGFGFETYISGCGSDNAVFLVNMGKPEVRAEVNCVFLLFAGLPVVGWMPRLWSADGSARLGSALFCGPGVRCVG